MENEELVPPVETTVPAEATPESEPEATAPVETAPAEDGAKTVTKVPRVVY